MSPPDNLASLSVSPARTLRLAAGRPPTCASARGRASCSPTAATPDWNHPSRELRFQGELVKVVGGRAPCQVLLLDAFQEEGWPPQMLNPLPPTGDRDPRDRLHNA